MYLDGGFTDEKYKDLLNDALDGNMDAKYELGMVWAIVGNQNNDRERVLNGIRTLEEASDGGSAAAMCYLGTIYQDGKFGIEADMKKAVAYYKIGAESGDALAMSNYGIALQRGDGGLQCDDKKHSHG